MKPTVAAKAPVVIRPPATETSTSKLRRSRRRLGVNDDHRHDQLLRRQPAVEELLRAARPEHGEASRHDQVEVARHSRRRQRNAQRALGRRRALADPPTSVKVTAPARWRVDRPVRPETAGQSHEPVIGRDHDPSNAGLAEARNEVPQQIEDGRELGPRGVEHS